MRDDRRLIAFGLVVALVAAGSQSARGAGTTRPSATRPVVPATRPAAATTRPLTAVDLSRPDLSTVKSAARSYVEAMLAADAKALRAVTAGDERAHEQAEASAAVTAATYELAAAVAERFGDEGRRFVPGRAEERARLVERIGKAREVVEGDTATLMEPDSGWLLTLRRDAAGWRVDLPAALRQKDDHARVLDWMAGKARVARELAAEVRAARYAKVGDVEAAQRQKTRQLSASQVKSQLNPDPKPGGGK